MPVIVFDEDEETEESIIAQSDKSLSNSVISQGLIKLLNTSATSCPKKILCDSNNKKYPVQSYADLRWHRQHHDKSYSERFFVIDSVEAFVILGNGAFLQNRGSDVNIIGLEQQTQGNVTSS